MDQKIVTQHGNKRVKQSSVSGHSFNSSTGCMDTIVDGVVVQSHQIMESQLMRDRYVVGSVSTLKLDYSSGESKWGNENGSRKMIVIKKG